MKIDYHLHLEEGPYTSNWLQKTFEATMDFIEIPEQRHTLPWVQKATAIVAERVSKGSLTSDWLDLYLLQAKKMELKEVGIVDHMYRFKEYKPYYEKYIALGDDEMGVMQRAWLDKVCMASITDFVDVIEQAKEKWVREGIKLRLGIEADYFIGGEVELEAMLKEYPYDYVIGSVHFLNGWGFDNPKLQHLYAEYDLEDLYDQHFQTLEKAISSGLFDIIAHLDNLKVFEYRPDEERLLPWYQRIAQKLVEMDTATELNAGLFYRYPIKEMCPSPTFLQVLADHQVSITISSDAHYPNDMGTFASMQLDTLKEHGFDKIATFKQRKRIEHPLT